jgi:hypothetical protein
MILCSWGFRGSVSARGRWLILLGFAARRFPCSSFPESRSQISANLLDEVGSGRFCVPLSRYQVTAKAQDSSKILVSRIDSQAGWRYSQAQIPDLVANANTRFRQPSQSFGSGSLNAARLYPKPAHSFHSFESTLPVAAALRGDRYPSTPQRRTGGHRNL